MLLEINKVRGGNLIMESLGKALFKGPHWKQVKALVSSVLTDESTA